MSMSRPRRQSRTPMPDLRGECVCSSSFAAHRRLPHAAPRGHRRGTLMCTKATIAATEHFASIGDDGLRSSHRLVDEVNDRTKQAVKQTRGTRCAIRSPVRRSPASGLQDSTENGSGAIAAAVLLLVFFPSAQSARSLAATVQPAGTRRRSFPNSSTRRRHQSPSMSAVPGTQA